MQSHFFFLNLQRNFITHSLQTVIMKHILLLAFALVASMAAMGQPKIEFDHTTQELGTLLWHVPQTATFKVINKGTQDLLITNVRTDCGCTNAEWTTTAIGPGSTGYIKATYNAEMLGHFNKGLAVYTNLDQQPHYLSLMGVVSMTNAEATTEYPYKVGEYYLSTDDVEFDDVNRGDSPTYVLSILNSSKKSFRPELMHLPKYLTAQADPAVIRPGRVGRILLTLNSNELHTMGLTQTSIYLSRFMGDRVSKETEINVSATLLPDFFDTPTQHALAPVAQLDSTHLTLGPLGKKKKVNGQVMLTNTGKTPLVISALQVYNPGISVSLNKRRIDPGHTEKMKITISTNTSYFKGRRRVLLITNDPDHPKIVIDVTVKK